MVLLKRRRDSWSAPACSMLPSNWLVLSLGQMRLLDVAKALAPDPLLDEPGCH